MKYSVPYIQYILFLTFCLFISSCTDVYIKSKSRIYGIAKHNTNGNIRNLNNRQGEKRIYSIDFKNPHTIKEDNLTFKDDHVVVKETNQKVREKWNDSGNTILVKPFTNVIDYRVDYLDSTKFYFPDPDDTTKATTKFKYYRFLQKKLDVAAVTVTARNKYKIRDNIENHSMVSDSFPSTWETGFSPGIVGSFSFIEYGSFNSKKNKLNKYSLDGGVLLAFSTTTLKSSTTRPKYSFERKALVMTYGGIINLSANKIDLGFSFGWDRAFGDASEDWVYQGTPYWGFILGYDIFKPK